MEIADNRLKAKKPNRGFLKRDIGAGFAETLEQMVCYQGIAKTSRPDDVPESLGPGLFPAEFPKHLGVQG